MKPKMWDSFRDELIATSMVLVVATIASFWFTNTLVKGDVTQDGPTPTPTQTVAQKAMADMVKVLGEKSELGLPTMTPSQPTPTVAITTPQPTEDLQQEVLYGVGGLYENDAYRLEINSPRLVTENNGHVSRKLVVDMVLYNKSVTGGFTNRLTAAIIKDGTVIVGDAAMSLTETKLIMPQEKLTFQAKISLIESTDVKEIHFKPTGVTPLVHMLLP